MSASSCICSKPGQQMTVRVFLAPGSSTSPKRCVGQDAQRRLPRRNPAHLTPMIDRELPKACVESWRFMQYLATSTASRILSQVPEARAMVDSAMFISSARSTLMLRARPTRCSASRNMRAKSARATPTGDQRRGAEGGDSRARRAARSVPQFYMSGKPFIGGHRAVDRRHRLAPRSNSSPSSTTRCRPGARRS